MRFALKYLSLDKRPSSYSHQHIPRAMMLLLFHLRSRKRPWLQIVQTLLACLSNDSMKSTSLQAPARRMQQLGVLQMECKMKWPSILMNLISGQRKADEGQP